MEDLKKICHVLELQRANLEREIAVLEGHIRAIDAQLKAISSSKTQMTQAVLSGDVSENIIQDARVLGTWAIGQANKAAKLKDSKQHLLTAKAPKTKALTEVLVKEDLLRKKLRIAEKAHYDEWVDTQASERLETWVNTNLN